MKKKKIYTILLDIGWKGWDDDDLKNLLEFILRSEEYVPKSLRGPVYPWKEESFLQNVKHELEGFKPDIIICFFDNMISPGAMIFLNQILEIYEGSKRPGILILNGRRRWYPPEGYEDIVDGHISVPFSGEYILQGIEYVLNKGEDDKMLHL